MKLRKGFVSNSSSASFIVTQSDCGLTDCQHCSHSDFSYTESMCNFTPKKVGIFRGIYNWFANNWLTIIWIELHIIMAFCFMYVWYMHCMGLS